MPLITRNVCSCESPLLIPPESAFVVVVVAAAPSVIMSLGGSTLLALYLTAMAVLIGGFFFLRTKFRKEDGATAGVAAPRPRPVAGAAAGNAAPAGARRAAGGRAARGALDRMRRDLDDRNANDGDAVDDVDSEDDGPVGADGAPIDPRDKKAMRKAEKAAARAARAEVRAQQEAADSHKKAKEDKYAEKRAAREAEREAAEAEAAAAEAHRAEEQRKKDAAELDEWKDMFTVTASGSVASDSSVESADQLEEFIRTIQTRKVVVLDDLAAQFHMKTPDVVARIQTLEADGRLTGVLDDRGKFLALTPAELDAVAAFIARRGRVTIADIVAESNKLIDLSGTQEEDNEQIVIDEDEGKEQ